MRWACTTSRNPPSRVARWRRWRPTPACASTGPEKDRKQETTDLCKEIDAIESQADRIQRKAITALFDGNTSIWTAIKMREFYALQEDVLDRCEDAAKTIEEILIENS